MQRASYTKEQRNEALDLLAQFGKVEAARRTRIPEGTITSWGHRLGVKVAAYDRPVPERIVALTVSLAERKQALADDMLDRARTMLAQLDHSMVERKSMVVSDGRDMGSHIETAEVSYDKPPTGAQKQIVEAVAILVDKVQLLTGQATQRFEATVTNQAEVAAARERAIAVLDELAERRAS